MELDKACRLVQPLVSQVGKGEGVGEKDNFYVSSAASRFVRILGGYQRCRRSCYTSKNANNVEFEHRNIADRVRRQDEILMLAVDAPAIFRSRPGA